tara:strand:+ start:1064 stop:1264 length:201 start_codon:yes stop_codon:yes gene_type:complete
MSGKWKHDCYPHFHGTGYHMEMDFDFGTYEKEHPQDSKLVPSTKENSFSEARSVKFDGFGKEEQTN